MAEFKVERWMPDGNLTGFPRRDRQGGEYSVYIPDRLVRRAFMLRGQEAADLGEAERDVERFDLQATVLANTEALPRILLRAESVGSSKIEGLEVGAQRLLRAEASEQLGHPSTDVTANDVVANIRAMEHALAMCDNGQPITPELLLEVHERLLRSAEHLNEFAGRFREVQNWIGESSFNPCSADFVPPPWELVPALLDDLCQFCNDDSLPVLAQAAIAHAAFETIHPFVNGNGRVGRALIHMILRRRRLTTVVTPPISLVLATFSRDYVRGLTATRYTGSRDADSSRDGINLWLGIFAAACRRAVSDALAFEEQIRAIQQRWRERLAPVRSGSATDLLIKQLPGAPIVTVSSAAKLIGRTVQATNEAIARFYKAGVLSKARGGERRRVFEAREIITTFTALERQLASTNGNTRTSPPIRRVPYRASLD